MENKLTPEVLEKAKLAKSAEELIALAKENGAEITAEEANTYFTHLHQNGELADDELDQVAGGCGGDDQEYYDGWPVVDYSHTCSHYLFHGWGESDGCCRTCRYLCGISSLTEAKTICKYHD